MVTEGMVLPRRYNLVANCEVVSRKPSRLSSDAEMRMDAVIAARGESKANKVCFQTGETLQKASDNNLETVIKDEGGTRRESC